MVSSNASSKENSPGSTPPAANEELLTFASGHLIFQQGEPGGDLFVVKEGEVHIFTTHAGKEVPLATMQPGEVIGTLTCLTDAARMASARAKGPVVLRCIRKAVLAKLLADLPPWMHIVLKDFTLRLGAVNQAYSQTLHKLNQAKERELTTLFIAAQVANAISACAPLIQIELDEIAGVLPDPLLAYIEPILGYSREQLEEILQIFVEAGMITLKIEQEKKRHFITLENTAKVKNFSEFYTLAKRQKIRKLLETSFSNKEIRVLSGLIRYAQSKELALDKPVRLSASVLAAEMEKKTGQAFDLEVLKQAEVLELVKLEKVTKPGQPSNQADHTYVSFAPRTLSYTLTHLSAYKKLLQVDAAKK